MIDLKPNDYFVVTRGRKIWVGGSGWGSDPKEDYDQSYSQSIFQVLASHEKLVTAKCIFGNSYRDQYLFNQNDVHLKKVPKEFVESVRLNKENTIGDKPKFIGDLK